MPAKPVAAQVVGWGEAARRPAPDRSVKPTPTAHGFWSAPLSPTWRFATSCFLSAVVHCTAFLLLALVWMPRPPSDRRIVLSATTTVPPSPTIERLNVAPPRPPQPENRDRSEAESAAALVERLVKRPIAERSQARREPTTSRPDQPPGPQQTTTLLANVGGSSYGLLDGRRGKLKGILLGDGGTPESEDAVLRGLRWLAAHQRDDGSWHFNHAVGGGCQYCTHPGNHASTSAATGLALLPFLGAGHTHRQGEFQETVGKGLDYLKSRIIATPLGGDLQDGINLYPQAIATLALCEAYALTHDRELDAACRAAITFIINAQDKQGGGWRYYPGQVGDTSVTGWMWPALKSGELNYLPVPPATWKGAWKFLDGVQDDSGAAYGYLGPERDNLNMTAVGLLCRMYGGWPRRHPGLMRGVRTLSRKGPHPTDLYFNYYAAQVLRHYGGEEWVAWNEKLREQLIRTQSREGHESGSWYFPDKHGDQGGRLYNTAMALLTLEVYYRYLPIYGIRVLGEDFGR